MIHNDRNHNEQDYCKGLILSSYKPREVKQVKKHQTII